MKHFGVPCVQRQGRHWGAYELPQGEGSGVGIGRRHKPLCRVRNWPLTACPKVRVRHARLRAQGSFVGAISMAPTWVFFSVETAPVTFSQCALPLLTYHGGVTALDTAYAFCHLWNGKGRIHLVFLLARTRTRSCSRGVFTNSNYLFQLLAPTAEPGPWVGGRTRS